MTILRFTRRSALGFAWAREACCGTVGAHRRHWGLHPRIQVLMAVSGLYEGMASGELGATVVRDPPARKWELRAPVSTLAVVARSALLL